ncbi:MAG: imidazole glycerol phosphate synthase subunit HisH [Alphaproteobacteria bacterium]|nr:imidazole glycerol phosphate synthase subunit HisH [Alphaproteobacteria bacterium]
MPEVLIVPTGAANLASVFAALRRLGAHPRLCPGADEAHAAERLVLPGVGAFGAARAALEAEGLIEVLGERVRAGRPTLCVCLGLQLLCRSSEESPGVPGLGVVHAEVTRFPAGVRSPQMGWNQVTPGPASRLVTSGYAYFANSYRIAAPPAGWACATTDHGGPFVSALERGDVLACQFHPELSGAWGQSLIARWGGFSC